LCVRIAEIYSVRVGEEYDISTPPDGASFEKTTGGFIALAGMQSVVGFFLIPFTWISIIAGIVFLFGRQIRGGEFRVFDFLICLPILLGGFSCSRVSGRSEEFGDSGGRMWNRSLSGFPLTPIRSVAPSV
jgi:hypothetical protein